MAMNKDDNIYLTARMGGRIMAAREAAGLSVYQLAEKLGASTAQVRCYEQGSYTIALERLFQLASLLQVPVSEIVDA